MAGPQRRQKNLSADTGEHVAARASGQRTLVWGFRSKHLGADVPNGFLADYVAQHPGETVGVAAIDPVEGGHGRAAGERLAPSEFGAITISPAAQAFHPSDSRAVVVYEFCQERGLPVLIEMGTDLAPHTVLEFSRPYLLDEVCRAFPDVSFAISDMGWPWLTETIALLAKQPNVYAILSGILRRPWTLTRLS